MAWSSIQIHTYTIIIVRIKPTRKHNTNGVEARETKMGNGVQKKSSDRSETEIQHRSTLKKRKNKDIPLGFAERKDKSDRRSLKAY